MKKARLCLILVIVLLFGTACTLQGTPSEAKRYEAEFLNLFDTYTKIVGYSEDKKSFEQQVNFIHDELLIYHELYDIYNDYEGVNNIKTINDNAGIKPVKVDVRIISLLKFCKEVYGMTDGQVNVAFGSVLSVWHDYREAGIDDPSSAELPPSALLQEAAKHTDIDDVIIDEEQSTVYLADSSMRLDVGAVAKGYAVEAVSRQAQKQEHVTSMLISVGGNVCAIGGKDGNGGKNQGGAQDADGEKNADVEEVVGGEKVVGMEKWKVGIQNPNEEASAEEDILETVMISDLSLVTSGDYQRYYTVDGKRYNHIIDPLTRMPAERYLAVTILCADSGLADALSTAAFLMDMENGMALVKSKGAQAVYVLPDGSIEHTEGFEELIAPPR